MLVFAQQRLTRVQVGCFHPLYDMCSPNVSLPFQMMTLRWNKLYNQVLGLRRRLSLGFMSLNLNIPLSEYGSAHCFFWPIISQTGCHGIPITSFSAGLRCLHYHRRAFLCFRHQGEEANSYYDSALPSPEKSDLCSVAKKIKTSSNSEQFPIIADQYFYLSLINNWLIKRH